MGFLEISKESPFSTVAHCNPNTGGRGITTQELRPADQHEIKNTKKNYGCVVLPEAGECLNPGGRGLNWDHATALQSACEQNFHKKKKKKKKERKERKRKEKNHPFISHLLDYGFGNKPNWRSTDIELLGKNNISHWPISYSLTRERTKASSCV